MAYHILGGNLTPSPLNVIYKLKMTPKVNSYPQDVAKNSPNYDGHFLKTEVKSTTKIFRHNLCDWLKKKIKKNKNLNTSDQT